MSVTVPQSWIFTARIEIFLVQISICLWILKAVYAKIDTSKVIIVVIYAKTGGHQQRCMRIPLLHSRPFDNETCSSGIRPYSCITTYLALSFELLILFIQQLFTFLDFIFFHLKLFFQLYFCIWFQILLESSRGYRLISFLTHRLYIGIFMKQLLELHQNSFNFWGRTYIIKLFTYGNYVFWKMDGDILLFFLDDFQHWKCKNLFEVLFAYFWTDFSTKCDENAPVVYWFAFGQFFIQKVVELLSCMKIRDFG